MKQNYQNPFKTKDSEIVAVLLATKQVLNTSHWENGVCYFIFQNKLECEKIISDYRNDKIVIGAKSLMEAIRTIKSIIRN